MYKIVLLLTFCFFFVNSLFCTNVDSLINQVEQLDGKKKIEALTILCWELKYANHTEALSYGLEALKLARIHSKKEAEAEVLKNISAVYLIKSDFDLARKYVNEAIPLFQRLNNITGVASVTNILGLIESNQGNYEDALKHFDKAIILYQAIGNTSKVISVEANIGNIYLSKGAFDRAIPYYERIVAHAKDLGDTEKLGLNIFNLGIVYVRLGDYPKALDYLYEASNITLSNGNVFGWIKAQNEIGLVFRRLDLFEEAIRLYHPALDKAKKLDNQNLIASISNNLGLCYFRTNDLEKALSYFNASLEIRQSLNILNVGHILNNIASVYQEQGKFELALDYFNQALEINTQLDLDSKIGLDKSDIGQLHLKQGNYSAAETFLLSAFSIFEKSKELKELTNITEVLTNLYQITNQKSEENNFNLLHRSYSDSLYSKEKLIASTRIIIREQLKEKTAQTIKYNEALAHSDSEHQMVKHRNKLKLFLLLGGFLIIIGIGVYINRKRVNSRKQELSENLATVQQEKVILQNSIEKNNREMVLVSLDLIQKEGLIEVFKTQLSNLAKKQPDNPDIRSLINQFDISNVITKDWSFFNDAFNKTFPGFIEKFRKNYPKLSQKELQHCILIKLNTPPAQAANILGINTESVHTARYRLRKKMNLVRQDSLEHTILNFK